MDRAEPHLTRTGLRYRRLDEPKVGFLGLTLRPRGQDDLTVHASRHSVHLGCMSIRYSDVASRNPAFLVLEQQAVTAHSNLPVASNA